MHLQTSESMDPRAASNEPEARLEQILFLIPGVVSRLAPMSMRDDIAQELRIAAWKAISRGANPHSPIAYLRSSARRLLARCRQKEKSGPTYLEPDRLSERTIAIREPALVPDYEVERSIVKARLNARLQGVYHLRFELSLPVRAVAAALGCDPRQVRRDVLTIARLHCDR